jgi:hypothetical protein
VKDLQVVTAKSYSVRICIAGDRSDAARICREFCFEVGLCVTLEQAEYIYTGGQESGLVIGLINYPRFPKEPEDIVALAEQLGTRLMDGLCQTSFCIDAPDRTIWANRRRA